MSSTRRSRLLPPKAMAETVVSSGKAVMSIWTAMLDMLIGSLPWSSKLQDVFEVPSITNSTATTGLPMFRTTIKNNVAAGSAKTSTGKHLCSKLRTLYAASLNMGSTAQACLAAMQVSQ